MVGIQQMPVTFLMPASFILNSSLLIYNKTLTTIQIVSLLLAKGRYSDRTGRIVIVLLRQWFKVILHKTNHPSSLLSLGTPDVLSPRSSARWYCSFVHQLSLVVTQFQLYLWGQKSQSNPATFILCLPKGKRQKEAVCGTAGLQPPLHGSCPRCLFPPGYHPDWLPQSPDCPCCS